jgi:1-deoxy-D-xylulose-5-phosphate reductoisomerase
MKIKISILGSTGSIGDSTLKIIDKKRSLFNINTLYANKNYMKICNQIKKYNPKSFVVNNTNIFLKLKKKFKKKKISILNSYIKISKKNLKNDITIAAIPGLAGLEPTVEFTKNSKKILLANKESVICGWNLIKKTSIKNKTKIIPIDSEHFSISKLLENESDKNIEKIFITASGGPFFKMPIKKFKYIKPKDAIKHPKWSMGKKISVDSATLMNKVLELFEAYKLFSFSKEKYEIIIHPQSLVHAIIKYKNGLTKILYHEPDMRIPILNAIFENKQIDKKILINNKNSTIKNLEFFEVNSKKFPAINIIKKKKIHKSSPIIINAANEIFVDYFLKNKIAFNSIYNYLCLVLKDENYKKYAIKTSNNLKEIKLIDSWARQAALSILQKKINHNV